MLDFERYHLADLRLHVYLTALFPPSKISKIDNIYPGLEDHL